MSQPTGKVVIVSIDRERYLALRERAREMRREPTLAEAALWKRLRNGRLGRWHFERQFVVGEFIVDFYCHAARLVVEVDGPVHDHQTERDEDRDATLVSQGLRVLRFPNERVLRDICAILSEIRRAAEDSPRPAVQGDPPLKRRVRCRQRAENDSEPEQVLLEESAARVLARYPPFQGRVGSVRAAGVSPRRRRRRLWSC